jgi:hypothetical protein
MRSAGSHRRTRMVGDKTERDPMHVAGPIINVTLATQK